MRNRFVRGRAMLFLAALTFTGGCDETVSGLSEEEIDVNLEAAKTALEDALYGAIHLEDVSGLDAVSFQEAHDLFAAVYADSPSNATAAFGYAITRIFVMEDDPDVRSVLDDIEGADLNLAPGSAGLVGALVGPVSALSLGRASLPLAFSTDGMRSVVNAAGSPVLFPVDPMFQEGPAIGEVQDVLRDEILPALGDALDALATIDDAGFVFLVTERMQGEDPETAEPLELDYTEVLAIQTGLSVARAAIQVASAYILEPDPLEDAAALVTALTPGSTFLTLSPSGESGLSDALSRLRDAAGFLLAGLANLEAETDDQSDDIIKYDPTGLDGDGLTDDDIAEARDVIEQVRDALMMETEFEITIGDDEALIFTADLREFFLTPIQDFKALLPPYSAFTASEAGESVAVVRWDALNLDEWVLPDPTISGIFPEFQTTADLLDVLPFAGVFVGSSAAGGYYDLTSIDGLDCFGAYLDDGSGCPFDDSVIYGASLSFHGENAGVAVTFDMWDQFGYYSYDGTYVVAEDLAPDTYTVDMNINSGGIILDAILTDMPGFDEYDPLNRARGGSQITFTWLGTDWVFERQ